MAKMEQLVKYLQGLMGTVSKLKNAKVTDVIKGFNSIAEAPETKDIIEFAWARVRMIAEADINKLYLSNIDLQKQFYKLLEASVRHGGEVDPNIVARFERDIRKAKLGPVLNVRARVEINVMGHAFTETQWLFDKDTVFDILVREGVIDNKLFGQMILDRMTQKVDAIAIKHGLRERVKELYNKGKHIVPLFPKSGANRVVVAKIRNPRFWREVALELASSINVDEWLISKGFNYKSFIKIGIMLERQGHRIELDDELKFKVVDLPECDGTVVFFREGVVSDMLKRMGWNPGIGFQGTLFNVDLGMFGKGTFVEVPDVWFKANGINRDVDIVINKDGIIGNAVIDGVEEGVLPVKSFLVMNNVADFRPKATLSRQFIEYHWKDDEESMLVLKELNKLQMNEIARGGSMLGYKYARLIDGGLPVDCPVVKEEHFVTVSKTVASKMYTINLKRLRLGDSHYIIGINDVAFKAMLKRYKIDSDPVNVVILPKTSVLAKDKKIGDVFEIGMFKNPVTPTADCPMRYIAVVGTHKGGMIYCHADAPHRLASGHDYDGDAVVIFDGSLFKYLVDKEELLPSLADIKLEEGGSPEIKTIEDIFDMIAAQMDTPVGKFENTLGKLWGVMRNRYSGATIDVSEQVLRMNAEIAATQVQGYINAQKKIIKGLIDHKEFVKFLNKLDYKGWLYKTDSIRTFLKKYKNAMVNNKIDDATDHVDNAEPHGELMKSIVEDARKLIDYRLRAAEKTDAKIKTTIYRRDQKKWVTGVHEFNFHNWLYATVEDANDIEKKAIVAISNKYWKAIVTVGNLMNMAATVKDIADRKIAKMDVEDEENDVNTLEASLSKANNKLMFMFNLVIRYLAWMVADKLVEEFKLERDRAEFLTWVYFGQRLSESAFMNAASDVVIDAMIVTYDKKLKKGDIIFDDDPKDPKGGNRKKKTKKTKKEAKVKTINVWFGANQNRELSNLYYRPFKFNGKQYYSVEHAYQTLKSGKFDEVTYNDKRWENGMVKITGKFKANTKTNIELMYRLILESFKQNEDAKKKLLATGDIVITHINPKTPNRTDIWTTKFPELLMKVREELKKGISMKNKSITFYTDGSYSSKSKKCGWGYISEDGKLKAYGLIDDKELSSMNQVGGELVAAVKAIVKAIELGYTEVVIKHDYKGVADWADGTWKTKKNATKRYKVKINELRKKIKITFVKISGDNNPADEIARMATGAKNAH